MSNKILLVKPPFFSPLTPPLGIAVLKSFLEQHGYTVHCDDFNVDPELWGIHHKYFGVLQSLERVTINDGYSKLWYVLNAHWLAVLNGADRTTCAQVLETVITLYDIPYNAAVIRELIMIAERFFKRLAELTNTFDLSDFSVVGTSTYTTSLASSLFMLRQVKQRFPHLMTMMGGGIFADDLALGSDNLKTLLDEYPFVDRVILGEGELLFLKVLQGELSGKRLVSIADIGGQTLDMALIPPPDFSDFDLEKYHHLSIEGARSCPFECSFCSETIQWGTYRKKPSRLLSSQMVELTQRHDNPTYFMGDSLMNPYLMPLSTELLEQPDTHIWYDGYLRADKVAADRERVKLWARSGMFRARLGIESASEHVLKLMSKMTHPQTISQVLTSLANAGIRTTTYWVVGFPGETLEDFEETIDFIREHHRYIYELEAHPYYYYPYGQVGSRLYVSASLYPESVTDVIRFKWWDIVGVQPTRQERYERLRRVSELAAELGLPNIYTMAERYQAEERWRWLHPLTVQVYAGSSTQRQPPPALEQPVRTPTDYGAQPLLTDGSSAHSALCYLMCVNKRLEPSLLAAALEQLGCFNEALQLSLQAGYYVGKSAEAWAAQDVPVYVVDDPAQSTQAIQTHVIETLSVRLQPDPGASVRIVLIQRGQQASEVLLLAHRAIADARSVVLLCEDLFRIYEQLAAGREISLRPLKQSWTADLRQRVKADRPADYHHIADRVETATSPIGFTSISLDKPLCQRIFSQVLVEYGIQAAAALAHAVWRCIAESLGSELIRGDIRRDYRAVRLELEYTAGALTYNYPWLSGLAVPDDPRQSLLQAQQALTQVGKNASELGSPPQKEAARFLLNLEYLVEKPWLGGDAWTPHGFILTDTHGPQLGYYLEITPVWSQSNLQVRFMYHDVPQVRAWVDNLVRHLPEHVVTILDHCERYVIAKRFWQHEFEQDIPQTNLTFAPKAPESAELYTWTWAQCEIAPSIWSSVQAVYGADTPTIILTAYVTLLSRLNGREDVTTLVSLNTPSGGGFVPLRLRPRWEAGFSELLQAVQDKLNLIDEQRVPVFDILAEFPWAQTHPLNSIFDVGFVWLNSQSAGPTSVEPMTSDGSVGRVALLLRATSGASGINLDIGYDPERLPSQVIESFRLYLVRILQSLAQPEQVALGEILLDIGHQGDRTLETLLEQEFRF